PHINGLDVLIYMSSPSDAAVNASNTLTFENVPSPYIAPFKVQNKLQLAMHSLTEAVQQQVIRVDKSSSNILMLAAFISD
ncbi:efflux RND transporter permease subunit, partial [Escherichia coli]